MKYNDQKTNETLTKENGGIISGAKIFPIIVFLLYGCFLTIDIALPSQYAVNNVIKYLSLLTCLWYATFYGREVLLSFAFIFTACADYFLLFTDKPSIGIAIFIFAQICHSVRFNPSKARPTLLYMLSVSVLVFAAKLTPIGSKIGYDLVVAVIYGFALLLSTFRAIQAYRGDKQSTEKKLAMVGMLLFVCCDICVALYNAGSFIGTLNWSGAFNNAVMILIWFFYLPSQFLLSYSASSASVLRFS